MFGRTFTTVVLVVFLAAIISFVNTQPDPNPAPKPAPKSKAEAKAKANPKSKAKAKPNWGGVSPCLTCPDGHNYVSANSYRGAFGTGHNIGTHIGNIGQTWGANVGGVNIVIVYSSHVSPPCLSNISYMRSYVMSSSKSTSIAICTN